jgi:hypothetical protein
MILAEKGFDYLDIKRIENLVTLIYDNLSCNKNERSLYLSFILLFFNYLIAFMTNYCHCESL